MRKSLHENDPIGFHVRDPKNRQKIIRGSLSASGAWHQVSFDGHEKFNSLALRMGDVGLGIYGGREVSGGKNVVMETVPNARDDVAVAHLYLDMVEEYGGMLCITGLICCAFSDQYII